MTDDTSPAPGRPSDTANIDPGTRGPAKKPRIRTGDKGGVWGIVWEHGGKSHHEPDTKAFMLALKGERGLCLDDCDTIKKIGTAHREDHGLEPWPLGDFDTTKKDAELSRAAARAAPPAEVQEPKWKSIMAPRLDDPDTIPDPAAPGIKWPEGGSIPITGRDFTEEKAIELGIIYEDRGINRVNVHEAARYIMERIAFTRVRIDDASKFNELRYFDRGKYYNQAETVIEMAAERLLGSCATNQRVSEIVKKIARTYPPRKPDDDDPNGWISVKNGYLNIYTRKLEHHHPGRVFTIQLPVEYKKGATSEAFKRFIWQVQSPNPYHPTAIPSDDMRALEEMMGYCLMPGYIHAWLFILLGEGQNGKGVLLNVISALLGEDNISAVPLQELDAGRDKFAAADLRGSLANICGDLSANELKTTGTVKKATGNDWIRGQQKGQAAFNFKNRAKMIFACNELPYTPDDTRGFARRPRIFTFDQQFTSTSPVKADPEILKKLTTPDQLSGILNIALDGLDRLRKNGALTGREDEEFEIRRFRNMQDTAGRFLEECVVVDQAFVLDGRVNRAHKTGRKELYDAYCAWCENNGYLKQRDREFNARVKELFNEVVRESRWEGDNPDEPNGRVWVGIRFEPL